MSDSALYAAGLAWLAFGLVVFWIAARWDTRRRARPAPPPSYAATHEAWREQAALYPNHGLWYTAALAEAQAAERTAPPLDPVDEARMILDATAAGLYHPHRGN